MMKKYQILILLMKMYNQNNKKYKNIYHIIIIKIEVQGYIEEYLKEYNLIQIYLEINIEDLV